MIVVLVCLGALKYSGHAPQVATEAYQASAFGQVSLEGYNTLDALAVWPFSVIAVTTLNQLGFTSKKEYIKTIWIVRIVIAIGFSILYDGRLPWKSFPIPAKVTSDANKGVYVLSEKRPRLSGQLLKSSLPGYGDGDLLHDSSRFDRVQQGILYNTF